LSTSKQQSWVGGCKNLSKAVYRGKSTLGQARVAEGERAILGKKHLKNGADGFHSWEAAQEHITKNFGCERGAHLGTAGGRGGSKRVALLREGQANEKKTWVREKGGCRNRGEGRNNGDWGGRKVEATRKIRPSKIQGRQKTGNWAALNWAAEVGLQKSHRRSAEW